MVGGFDNDVVVDFSVPLPIDHTIHVQSFDPVTTYEPQLSSAMHVITSKCFEIDATGLPRLTLITFNELSQQPAA